MAVDLAITVDEYSLADAESGNPVSRIVRVFNNSDEDAVATIRSDLTSQLQNPTWTRSVGLAQFFPTAPAIDPPPELLFSQGGPQSFGDINNDGFKDYFTQDFRENSTVIYFGNEVTENSDSLTLEQIQQQTESQVSFPFYSVAAVEVGDINDDGHADFAFDTHVVLGTDGLGDPNNPDLLFFEVDTGFTSAQYFGDVYSRFAGDINGDAIDDLMFVMSGPSCEGNCTASEKDASEVDAGVAIVLGDPALGESGSVSAVSDGFRFPLILPYRPQLDAHTQDLNDDGLADIVISTTTERAVVFGSSDLESIDLRDVRPELFSGTNGFLTSSSEQDIREFSFDLATEQLAGSGDILEQVNIPAGTSLIYEITGQLRPGFAEDRFAEDLIGSVISQQVPDSDLSNNVFPRNHAAHLRVESSATVESEGSTTLDATIENRGPATATDLSVFGSVTQTLINPSWTLATERLFPELIEDHMPSLGPSLEGITRTPNLQGLTTSSLDNYDLYFREFGQVGFLSGAAGDLNGDGFEDFFISRSREWPGSRTVLDVFFGGPGFGNDGTFESVRPRITLELPERTSITNAIAVGDTNDDGTDDLVLASGSRNDAPSYWIFRGQAEFSNETYVVSERTEAPGSSSPMARGDFDGDGLLDSATRSDAGDSVLVTFGQTDGEATRELQISGTRARFADFGSVPDSNQIAVGDLNHDGIEDLIVSFADTVVFFGGEDFGNAPDIAINNASDRFVVNAFSVASGFDINADGIDDLIVGDPYHVPWGEFGPSGEAYVIFGRRGTNLSGTGSIEDIRFDIHPHEQVMLRVSGTSSSVFLPWRQSILRNVDAGPEHIVLEGFDGVPSEYLRTELRADIDQDGIVGFSDFLILSHNFGRVDVTEAEGDISGDGQVMFLDFLLLAAEFSLRDTV